VTAQHGAGSDRLQVIRYNNLLPVINASLLELQKAIKGTVVMSDQLEKVGDAMFANQVPRRIVSWGCFVALSHCLIALSDVSLSLGVSEVSHAVTVPLAPLRREPSPPAARPPGAGDVAERAVLPLAEAAGLLGRRPRGADRARSHCR
jgi:hypothetical protein